MDGMTISSSQLEAFGAVAKHGSFSRAAAELHITQSALSQRVMNLESDLGTTLIIRDSTGPRLTPAGEDLLRYFHVKFSLEQEVLAKLSSKGGSTASGVIRIAGFSSVMRSIIMPSLSQLIVRNCPGKLDFMSREIRELPRMLSSGEVDFIVTTSSPFKDEIENYHLGFEENVVVESTKHTTPEDVYLDHDVDDPTTIEMLKLNGMSRTAINRLYVDEIYAIIDAVKAGWGRAVVPRHLIEKEKGLKVVKGFKPLKVPVMLQHFRMPYYSKLHESLRDAVVRGAAAQLVK